ncbi:hypothetical protein [Microbacterium sp. NPDC087665]|uniref:hypothetical protein n=1 Tax=Microbacterium sp. NPDC087665 TaxID=3364194 RepID=UPI00380CCD37
MEQRRRHREQDQHVSVYEGSPSSPRRRWAAHLWWICAVIGCAVFIATSLLAPSGREDNTLLSFVVKLFAYVALTLAIALFPVRSRTAYLLLLLPFAVITGYLVPRISGLYFTDTARVEGDTFYLFLYNLLFPLILLTTAAAYRFGGGTSGRVVKISLSGAILLFSGFLDIMWWVVNPVDLPTVIDAPHINAITGGPIPFGWTIVFALAHVPLLIGVNLLPLDRWLASITGTEDGSRS